MDNGLLDSSIKPALFITGTSGFLGKHLLKQIDPADFSSIILLNRHEIELPGRLAARANVQQITGTLHDSERYSEYLSPETRIIHLAGLTGKADREAYFETNTRGTEHLIRAAESAGVHGFLFVSSIAVSFEDRKAYYYAESKQLAEEILQSGGLHYAIVRPTMILGEGSPVLTNLSSLAKGPVILQPGSGNVPIQPVDVDDLAGLLLEIVEEDAFKNEILEVGGPESLSVGEFLQKIHFGYHQKRGFVIKLPLRLILFGLRSVEPIIGKYLPVSSGQFASFCNPGTARANAWLREHSGNLKNVDAMLSEAKLFTPDTNLRDDPLARECSVYTRYLANQEPDAYVLRKYAEAFAPGNPLAGENSSRFESLIARISIKHPIFARAVDGYCKVFYRDSKVRKKLVLLLAVLESRAATAHKIDRPDPIKPPLILLTFLTQVTRSILLLLIASIVLSPMRLGMVCVDAVSGRKHG